MSKLNKYSHLHFSYHAQFFLPTSCSCHLNESAFTQKMAFCVSAPGLVFSAIYTIPFVLPIFGASQQKEVAK